jgi:hypothetical protein
MKRGIREFIRNEEGQYEWVILGIIAFLLGIGILLPPLLLITIPLIILIFIPMLRGGTYLFSRITYLFLKPKG